MQNATVKALTKSVSTTRKAPNMERTSRISALWAAFDSATDVVTSKHLPVIAEKCGLNVTTVRCQFYAWRATRATH